jgi:hypothetical protein
MRNVVIYMLLNTSMKKYLCKYLAQCLGHSRNSTNTPVTYAHNCHGGYSLCMPYLDGFLQPLVSENNNPVYTCARATYQKIQNGLRYFLA